MKTDVVNSGEGSAPRGPRNGMHVRAGSLASPPDSPQSGPSSAIAPAISQRGCASPPNIIPRSRTQTCRNRRRPRGFQTYSNGLDGGQGQQSHNLGKPCISRCACAWARLCQIPSIHFTICLPACRNSEKVRDVTHKLK